MRTHLLRTAASSAAVALVATGCGLVGGPSLSTSDEVVAALRALGDSSMRARVTAEVNIDEDELRDAVRADDRLLSLMDEAQADGATAADLLADLEELRTDLAEHAVLFGRGEDRSVRVAVESQGTVWADVRARVAGPDDATDGDGELAASYPADLQLRVDWDHLGGMLDDASIVDDINGAAATLRTVAPDIAAGVPAVQPVLDVILGFLDGDEVGFSGAVDTAAWQDALGPMASALGLDAAPFDGTDPTAGLVPDVDAYLATALTFDDIRTEGGRTLVDLTVNVREVATLFAQDAEGMLGRAPGATAQLDELEASLDELPEQLTDVATLAFDGDGVLQQVRVDLFALVVQAGAAMEPQDQAMQALAGASDVFDQTGAFLVVDVTDIGEVASVLGDPATTATWDDVLAALQGAAGMLGPMFGAMGGIEADPTLSPSVALSVTELGEGDCFDDDVLYGLADPAAQRVFSCAVPHDNEVFAMVAFAGEDRAIASSSAYDACLDAFESVLGSDHLESELFVAVLEPSADELASGIDAAACYAFGSEPRTGTVAGSGT